MKQFDCGSLNPDAERLPEPPRENEPGERIPTLDEVFDLVRQRSYRDVRFNIEIKTVPGSDETIALEDFVATVVDVVAGTVDGGIVGSASPELQAATNTRTPEARASNRRLCRFRFIALRP